MNKILVIGCNGQLGHCVKDVNDNLINPFDITYVDYDVLDITDFYAVDTYLTENKFDYIINCAAYTNVPKAEFDEYEAFEVNTIGPKNIAEVCNKLNIKFIHISTDYVYDDCHLINENTKTNPLNAYGRTKLTGDYNALSANPDTIILRTAWLYSCYGKNFVKTIINNIDSNKHDINVVFDQIGSPTEASDLAYAILSIIKSTSEGTSIWKGGVYHYTNEGFCSWYDFATMINEFYCQECIELNPEGIHGMVNNYIFDYDIKPITTKEFDKLFLNTVKRPMISMLDKSKIKNQFGIHIPHWTTALSGMIHLFVKNRKEYEPEKYVN